MIRTETWSNCDSNPLQDLIDWAGCVEEDPLKEYHLSVIELEEAIKKVNNG